MEKRSYYDCIRIKTDDGQREYLLPIHAYPGRRMVLELAPAPPRARSHTNGTTVQDVWRLEQFALTAVDELRGGLSKARIKISEISDARTRMAHLHATQPLQGAWGDETARTRAGAHDVDASTAHEEEEEYRRAVEEMQAEMQELEREIFLGPGVEMGHENIFVGHSRGSRRAAPAAPTDTRKAAKVLQMASKGIGGRGATSRGAARDAFEMPFDFPVKALARDALSGTPSGKAAPQYYVPASNYVSSLTKTPRGKGADGTLHLRS